jgi:hypothetical protein
VGKQNARLSGGDSEGFLGKAAQTEGFGQVALAIVSALPIITGQSSESHA